MTKCVFRNGISDNVVLKVHIMPTQHFKLDPIHILRLGDTGVYNIFFLMCSLKQRLWEKIVALKGTYHDIGKIQFHFFL